LAAFNFYVSNNNVAYVKCLRFVLTEIKIIIIIIIIIIIQKPTKHAGPVG